MITENALRIILESLKGRKDQFKYTGKTLLELFRLGANDGYAEPSEYVLTKLVAHIVCDRFTGLCKHVRVLEALEVVPKYSVRNIHNLLNETVTDGTAEHYPFLFEFGAVQPRIEWLERMIKLRAAEAFSLVGLSSAQAETTILRTALGKMYMALAGKDDCFKLYSYRGFYLGFTGLCSYTHMLELKDWGGSKQEALAAELHIKQQTNSNEYLFEPGLVAPRRIWLLEQLIKLEKSDLKNNGKKTGKGKKSFKAALGYLLDETKEALKSSAKPDAIDVLTNAKNTKTDGKK